MCTVMRYAFIIDNTHYQSYLFTASYVYTIDRNFAWWIKLWELHIGCAVCKPNGVAGQQETGERKGSEHCCEVSTIDWFLCILIHHIATVGPFQYTERPTYRRIKAEKWRSIFYVCNIIPLKPGLGYRPGLRCVSPWNLKWYIHPLGKV